MTLIVQITDPHLRTDGADPCHDPAHAVRRAFAAIAALDVRPDAIVLTGDIIDRSAKDCAYAMSVLREAPVRLLPLPGNHDRADAFRAAFSDWAPFAEGHPSFVVPLGEALLIGLDSTLPGGRGGVDDTRLDWLRGALSKAQSPVILALHHPPFPVHAPHLDRASFAGAECLASAVRGTRVCRVIAGHSHRGILTPWAGVLSRTSNAIGHGLTLSLSGDTPHEPAAPLPAFELHCMRSGAIVSHQIVVS